MKPTDLHAWSEMTPDELQNLLFVLLFRLNLKAIRYVDTSEYGEGTSYIEVEPVE